MKIKKTLWWWLAGAGFLLALGLGTLVFFALFEHKTHREPLPPDGQAAINPWFASEHYLSALPVPWAKTPPLYVWPTELGPRDVLWVTEHSYPLDFRTETQLKQWMLAGGHLVIDCNYSDRVSTKSSATETETENSAQDAPKLSPEQTQAYRPWLPRLGVACARSVASQDRDKKSDDDDEDAMDEAPATSPAPNVLVDEPKTNPNPAVTVRLRPQWPPLKVQLFPERTWVDYLSTQVLPWPSQASGRLALVPDVAARVGADAWLLSAPYGQGRLTVMSENDFWQHQTFLEEDHAALLAQVLFLHGQPHKIWRADEGDMPSIMVWLYQHAWPLLLGWSVFLLFWIWAKMPRFGPVLPSPQPVRRRLLEHVAATGLWYWQRGNRARLLHAARQPVLEHLHRRHPHWSGLAAEALVRELAEETGLSQPGLRLALHEQPQDPQAWTLALQTLDRLQRLIA